MHRLERVAAFAANDFERAGGLAEVWAGFRLLACNAWAQHRAQPKDAAVDALDAPRMRAPLAGEIIYHETLAAVICEVAPRNVGSVPPSAT